MVEPEPDDEPDEPESEPDLDVDLDLDLDESEVLFESPPLSDVEVVLDELADVDSFSLVPESESRLSVRAPPPRPPLDRLSVL